MKYLLAAYRKEWLLPLGISFLFLFGIITLRSIAPFVFPTYFIYVIFAVLGFIVFSLIDFEVLRAFSPIFYAGSIVFLIIPLLIGQVTRGAVRWIPIGSLTIQPSELVKPMLLLFFAYFLTKQRITTKRAYASVILFLIPTVLVLLQPALGMTVLVSVGFVGTLLSVGISKRIMLTAAILGALVLPFSWFFMAPYQKARVNALFSPTSDPSGAGYNSIQSMISVGSGKLTGRGLGEGVQTQLAFLPERHTDFIFASVSEELGLVGAALLVLASFFVLYRITTIIEHAQNPAARAFVAGVFLTLFTQTVVHIGMNMGLFPITGLPLPLVSAGGSSLIGTMIMLGMVVSAKKDTH